MSFLGVYRAIYDYAPQSEGELEVTEGDLLFVLEKSTEDDWWKAKKKALSDEEDEPEGLVPKTYIEEVSHRFESVMALRYGHHDCTWSLTLLEPNRPNQYTTPKHYTTTQNRLTRKYRLVKRCF